MDRIKSLIAHPLVTGSSVIFVGTFIANLVNYFFNLLMGRMLTVTDYGLLTTLSSLFILIAIFGTSFGNIITKYSAKYFGSGNDAGARAVFTVGAKVIGIFSFLLLIVLVVAIPFFSSFLHVTNDWYILLIILSIFFSLLLALPSGYVLGRMRFHLMSGITAAQPVIKLLAAVVLLALGFSLAGPLIGLVLAGALPTLVLFYYLYKDLQKAPAANFDYKGFQQEFIREAFYFFLAGIGLTLLQNIDIILVRHFFDPTVSGQYAALSLMGKAIFYFTSPITAVFFPLIAYKKERSERLFTTVMATMLTVAVASAGLSFIYFAFPHLILKIFFPKPAYQVLSNYLGFFSLYILVFSLASLLNSFYLSIGKTGVYKITIVAAFAQIILIVLFHRTLFDVIVVLFGVSFVLFLSYLGYYIKYHGKD